MPVRTIIHLLLHIALPGVAARLWFRPRWLQVWLIMLATMLVDLDHLLAEPVFDPMRCGIGFHPLHSYPAIAVYAAGMALPAARPVALGLLIHMFLDGVDCVWITASGGG